MLLADVPGVCFLRVLPFSPHLLTGAPHMSLNNLARDAKLNRKYICDVYVLRKVGIGAIPELHLRKVGIPTLSANSRIVPDNSRIVQGKYIN